MLANRPEVRVAAAHAFADRPPDRAKPADYGIEAGECQVMQAPVSLFSTPPSTRREGTARIRARLDATGRVLAADVIEASHRDVGRSSARAVQRWQYAPALCDGQPVESWVEQRIRVRNESR